MGRIILDDVNYAFLIDFRGDCKLDSLIEDITDNDHTSSYRLYVSNALDKVIDQVGHKKSSKIFAMAHRLSKSSNSALLQLAITALLSKSPNFGDI